MQAQGKLEEHDSAEAVSVFNRIFEDKYCKHPAGRSLPEYSTAVVALHPNTLAAALQSVMSVIACFPAAAHVPLSICEKILLQRHIPLLLLCEQLIEVSCVFRYTVPDVAESDSSIHPVGLSPSDFETTSDTDQPRALAAARQSVVVVIS
jgi:hypothetical protein